MRPLKLLRWPMRIRTALTLCYTGFFFVSLLVVVGVTGYLTSLVMTENTRDYAHQFLVDVKLGLQSYLMELETLASTVAKNPAVLDFVRSEQNFDAEHRDRWNQRLSEVTNTALRYEIGVHSIGIFGRQPSQSLYFGTLRLSDVYPTEYIRPQYERIQASLTGKVWLPSFSLAYSSHELFAIQQSIVDGSSFAINGVVTVNIRTMYLNMKLADSALAGHGGAYVLGDGAFVGWTGASDNGLFGADAAQLARIQTERSGDFIAELDGVRSMVVFDTLKNNGWKVVGVIPLEGMLAEANVSMLVVGAIGVVICLATLALSILVAGRIVRPIRRLTQSMGAVQQGDTQVRVRGNSFYEIDLLSRGFNDMLDHINELIFAVYEQEIREKDARMEALQAQINPHFLYNTLDTINAMLIIEHNYMASQLVTNLADIMRYSISDATRQVTLSTDLAHIEEYLHIQKARFGEGFDYQIDVERDMGEAFVLKLLIQPIVENAIAHGIEKRRGYGWVHISAHRDQDDLVIAVSDNGVGMPQSTVEQLLKAESVLSEGASRAHIGVKNVYNRMRLFYGADHCALNMESVLGEGTTVTLRLPFRGQWDKEGGDIGAC